MYCLLRPVQLTKVRITCVTGVIVKQFNHFFEYSEIAVASSTVCHGCRWCCYGYRCCGGRDHSRDVRHNSRFTRLSHLLTHLTKNKFDPRSTVHNLFGARSRKKTFMAALCNRTGHYIFALWFLSFFFFFFPRLISAVADWMSTILPHIVCP